MKKVLIKRIFVVFSLFLLWLIPSLAYAITGAKDWTMLSSLNAQAQDSATSLNFNIKRCRDLFSISSGELSLIFTLKNTSGLGSKAEYAVKFARPHQKCDKASLDPGEDECQLVYSRQSLSAASSPIEVRRSVNSVSTAQDPDTCENLEETSYVYLIVNDPGLTGDNIYTVSYSLDFRTKRPEAPSALKGTAGEKSIDLEWGQIADVTQYTIFYCTEGTNIVTGMAPESLSSCNSMTSAKSSTSIKSGINADTNYLIGVVANDNRGNESLIGEVITLKTISSDDFWESFKKENQDVDGGFCFIATAAWGSTQEPHVVVLRQFRDKILMQNPLGRAFVAKYYELSPPAAKFIQDHSGARIFSRIILWPLYFFAILCLYITQVGALALTFSAALFAGLIFNRYRR